MLEKTLSLEAAELISPCGGRLVDLTQLVESAAELKEYASRLPSIVLTERSVCDLELLASGAFSPLDGFMGRDDYQSVLAGMRLAGGHLFPVPLTLPVDVGAEVRLDRDVALRSSKNELLAVMTVEEIFSWSLEDEAREVYGTRDLRHPLVAEMQRWGTHNIAGRLRVLQMPSHYDFLDLRLTPAETRVRLSAFGRPNVVAFQTRNPLHRAHEEMTKQAAARVDGVLLLQPVVGMTKPGDIDHYTRVRTYKVLAERYYEHDGILLSLLPLAMRFAGPREALWHALIRRNYGANYLVVGRNHASPGNDSAGKPFYGPYDAQELVERHATELGVRPLAFKELVYLPDEERYEETSRSPAHAVTASISGTQVREEYLLRGRRLPEWYTRPEIAEILAQAYPPRHRQGVCIWFTGLSGSGKSTTADVLAVVLNERGRQTTLLDGDVVRTHLSKGLGFGKADRDTNVRRIGFVATEVVRHGGVAIAAAVSPYRATRNDIRNMIGSEHFIEVFVDTPLEVCEGRDMKGMYAKARRGETKGFTGIDDPYEPPLHAELTLETIVRTPAENARAIIDLLAARGFVQA
jgi:sulfate adenylyltransferase